MVMTTFPRVSFLEIPEGIRDLTQRVTSINNRCYFSTIKKLFYENLVLSRPTHRLLDDLHAARANGTHARMFARVLRCDLLVLDDLGLQELSVQAIHGLYELITEQYERGSLIITSNRALERWSEVFHNDLLASAKHRSVIGIHTGTRLHSFELERAAHQSFRLSLVSDAYGNPVMISRYSASSSELKLRQIQGLVSR